MDSSQDPAATQARGDLVLEKPALGHAPANSRKRAQAARVTKLPTSVRHEDRQPIYSISVEPFDRLQVFAAVGGTNVSIYRVMPNGFLDLIQSYTDSHNKENFYCCCWSRSPSDEPWLCVAGANGAIKVINMKTQALDRYLYGHGGDINDMKACPKDVNIVLTASKDESLRLWNLASSACLAIFAGSKGH
eukprot:SAG31_NODE_13937_length_836_cov_1.401628_2_plen_189_part_01